ncbi:MAG TPA: VWA domain-containing protein [Pyrinomonadaceae bacterium]|nr:VWA domain-containing protein [Pyrinomonadaceae bacterium]HNU07048.1 VWA domain-containing protein [Pyrinomonadaceae bacterium]
MTRISTVKAGVLIFATFFGAALVLGQSRNVSRTSAELDGVVITVAASRKDDKAPIKLDNLSLYENSVEQKIRNFAFDPSPSKIVLLIDNSQTLPTDIETMKRATMEFAYEIFEGDQLFVIAYDEKPEIIQEWTDDAKKMETSLATFRKRGNPYLFDALTATSKEVLAPLVPGTRKVAIVVIGDGLDRGSKSDFTKTLAELQGLNVTVYFLQIPDRTNGAFRRNQPKAREVVTRLVEGTGGLVFPLEDAQNAAKTICDELRNNRYNLSYVPTNTSSFDQRRIFLLGQDGITVRTKAAHPPTIK